RAGATGLRGLDWVGGRGGAFGFRHAMPLPVRARSPLVPLQRGPRMRGLGERPLQVQVGPKADDVHALAALGDSVIRGVQEAVNDAVGEAVMLPSGVALLKP